MPYRSSKCTCVYTVVPPPPHISRSKKFEYHFKHVTDFNSDYKEILKEKLCSTVLLGTRTHARTHIHGTHTHAHAHKAASDYPDFNISVSLHFLVTIRTLSTTEFLPTMLPSAVFKKKNNYRWQSTWQISPIKIK